MRKKSQMMDQHEQSVVATENHPTHAFLWHIRHPFHQPHAHMSWERPMNGRPTNFNNRMI